MICDKLKTIFSVSVCLFHKSKKDMYTFPGLRLFFKREKKANNSIFFLYFQYDDLDIEQRKELVQDALNKNKSRCVIVFAHVYKSEMSNIQEFPEVIRSW